MITPPGRKVRRQRHRRTPNEIDARRGRNTIRHAAHSLIPREAPPERRNSNHRWRSDSRARASSHAKKTQKPTPRHTPTKHDSREPRIKKNCTSLIVKAPPAWIETKRQHPRQKDKAQAARFAPKQSRNHVPSEKSAKEQKKPPHSEAAPICYAICYGPKQKPSVNLYYLTL